MGVGEDGPSFFGEILGVIIAGGIMGEDELLGAGGFGDFGGLFGGEVVVLFGEVAMGL